MIDEEAEFLAWIWRYGSPTIEGADTLEEAVSTARHAEDYGEGSFSHIEHVGHGIVDHAAVRAEWDRQQDAERAVQDAAPKATHVAWLRCTIDGSGRPDWASLGGFSGDEPAWLAAAWRRFGDRVRVTAVGKGRPR